MALSLMQIGLLTYRDWAKPWAHESDLIERALTRWLRRATADLQMFQFAITYSDRRASQVTAYRGWDRNTPEDNKRVSFTIYRIGDLPSYTLRAGITELEQAFPCLGETALHYLAKAAVLPMLTPQHALYLASATYWHGEGDETYRLQEELEYCDPGTKPEDVEIYRKRDFLTAIPEWAALPKQHLTQTSLRRIALDHAGTTPGEVAAVLLEIARIRKGAWRPNTQDENMDCSDVAALFRWSDDDDCGRIVDDAMNDIINAGESTDDFGSAYLLPDPEPLKAWLRSAEKSFRLLRLCERLVRLVGTTARD